MTRQRASIRFWQTGLFVVVIVVAMLIMSGSLSTGLQATLSEMGTASEIRNASGLARRLEPELPLSPTSVARIEQILREYRTVYGAGVWVFDRAGVLIAHSYDTGPSDSVLETARATAMADLTPYATIELRPGGWSVAARTILDGTGVREGVVVTASSVDQQLRVLDAVRGRLWITFWISLVIAGLLGLTFSDFIRKRIIGMLDAAEAIAGGDFEQRLPTGLVPDEIQELALAYNRMAVTLGGAFGSIRESERQIAAVVESMAEGVVAFDAAGIVHVVNPEAERLLRLEAAGTLSMSAETAIAYAEVLEVVRAGLEGRSTARIVHVDDRIVLLNCSTLFDADGSVDGAVLVLQDVTEQRRIEHAQRRFVADASHEMRTPIAALKGILELLADGAKDDPEVRDDFITTMQVETDRLGRLVTDLLTLAQLDAGSLSLNVEPEWATDLLGDVARLMHGLAEQADVVLAVEPPADDVQVLADHDRVVQVLLSFTDNALKHSPPGATVRLRGVRKGGAVRFEVVDEGQGIDAEKIDRVFERFYRDDAARAGRGGAGLGLSIAKEIVEAHGSLIGITSAPGAGTTLGFTLPVA